MSDDYLWDRSGPVDSDVARLEQVLVPFRAAPAEWKPLAGATAVPRRRPSLAPLALAAALFLAILVRYAPSSPARPTPTAPPGGASKSATPGEWTVARLQGAPVIERVVVDGRASLPAGALLATDAGSRARLVSNDVGEVIVEPGSRVRLVASAAGRVRLALERGELQAFIVAPPGRFVVETPSATAVDLGCVYSLRVGDNGDGVLSVSAGWVAFEFQGRESFVPAGASCPTRAATGPGLPRFDDASAAFVEALDALERPGRPGEHAVALHAVLREARPRDAMTLWHLIPRVAADERPGVVRALKAIVPLPRGVDADRVLQLDRQALDRWWDALGLGEARTWREWKRPLPLTR